MAQAAGGQNSKAQCINFVRNNPAAFTDARWLVNSLNVFSQ